MLKSPLLRAANAKSFSEALGRAKKLSPQGLFLHIEELQRAEDAFEEDALQFQKDWFFNWVAASANYNNI